MVPHRARQRAEYLLAAAERCATGASSWRRGKCYECGKPWREADADVAEAIDFCVYYAQGAIALDRRRECDLPGEENRYVYLPRGVAAVIAPWNFPLAILTGMTAAALVTGNTVVMKPAEQSSVIAAKLMEILQDVGIPDGVVNYLPGKGEEVGARAGRASRRRPDRVHRIAQRRPGDQRQGAEVSTPGTSFVKRVIAEMGGKNAIIVDDDADLDEAVLGVVVQRIRLPVKNVRPARE